MFSSKQCECGCGKFTKVATSTRPQRGWVKGEPLRYARGHKAFRTNKRYQCTTIDGRIERIHRVRATRALGKPLPPQAVIHHSDGSKRPDAPLVICEDIRYHNLLHFRMRVLEAGGNPNTDRVCRCGFVGPKASCFSKDKRSADGFGAVCRQCARKLRRLRAIRERDVREPRLEIAAH